MEVDGSSCKEIFDAYLAHAPQRVARLYPAMQGESECGCCIGHGHRLGRAEAAPLETQGQLMRDRGTHKRRAYHDAHSE